MTEPVGAGVANAEPQSSRITARRTPGLVLALGNTPWTIRDLTRLAGTCALVASALVASWVAVSTTVDWSRQMIWLAVGVAGVVVVGCSSGRWLLVGFRGVHQRQRLVEARTAALDQALLVVFGHHDDVAPGRQVLVSGPTMNRYHLASCPLVKGKQVSAASLRRHAAAGRSPCGVCQP
jgi:hypothetical protein